MRPGDAAMGGMQRRNDEGHERNERNDCGDDAACEASMSRSQSARREGALLDLLVAARHRAGPPTLGALSAVFSAWKLC